MPGALYGLAPSAGKQILSVQSQPYWPGGNASSIPFTMATAPRNSMIAVFGGDPGTLTPYSISQTGYTWRPLVARYQVDAGNYPPTSMWIGQPNARGVAGGVSVTGNINGVSAFPCGVIFEMNRMLKGEVVTNYSWYAWAYGTTSLDQFPLGNGGNWQAPNERGLVAFFGISERSGGYGPHQNSGPPSYASNIGGLVAGMVWPVVPKAVYTPAAYITGDRGTGWTGVGIFIR